MKSISKIKMMVLKKVAVGFSASLLFFNSGLIMANPIIDNVAAGNVSIQQSNQSLIINQSSNKAILNWKSFNIGQQERTHFQQPQGGVALNRISPLDGASQIYGQLTATGQIILVNPAGIYFGPSAYVNVGGLIATTADITDQNFLNGTYKFTAVPNYSGAVINDGYMVAANHGLIALVAPGVINNGHIEANLGHIILGGGDSFTLNFSGDGLINFAINTPTTSAGTDYKNNKLRDGVKNTGTLIANGGKILISAKAAEGVVDNVINMQGVAEARSVYQENGEIILSGDPNAGVVRVAANIDASGKAAHQKGGHVQVTGHDILLDDSTVIDVSGDSGGGNIEVGGNYAGLGPIPNAHATVLAPHAQLIANAIQQGTGGNIIVWSDQLTKVYGSLSAQGGLLSGDGGFIETSSHGILDVAGIKVDTRAPYGKIGLWLLDPRDVFITAIATSGGSFNGGNPNVFTPTANNSNILNTEINNNLAATDVTITTGVTGAQSGNIFVNAPITWSSTNTLNLQAANNIQLNAAITGVNGGLVLSAVNAANSITTNAAGAITVNRFNLLQGQWTQIANPLPSFTATNFQINSGILPAPTARFIRALSGNGTVALPYLLADIYGLQGIGTSAATLGLSYQLANNINANGTSSWNSGTGFVPIGTTATAFTGRLNGSNFTVDGLWVNKPGLSNVGLIGRAGGTALISNINLSNIMISGASFVGGLIGQMSVNVQVSNANVTGIIQGGNDTGGLIGSNVSGSVSNTSSSASVSGTTNALRVGGLMGSNQGIVTNSHSTGLVSAGGPAGFSIGGLIGNNKAGGTISNSFSNSPLSIIGYTNAGGLVGLNAGTITNSYSTGLLNVSNSFGVGGLVGNNSGTISNVFSSSPIIAISNGFSMGGLVGRNQGGSINNAYSTGQLNVLDVTGVGGLVGRNDSVGTINNVYTSSGIIAENSDSIGGLVGSNEANSTVSHAYSTGMISTGNSTNIGGFVGNNQNLATISDSFWDTDTSGQASGLGANAGSINNLTSGCFTGICTNGGIANLTLQSTYTTAPHAWDFTTIWNIVEGASYPYLRAFYPTTPRAISGILPVSHQTISLAVNGVVKDTVYTGANGFYYMLEGNNVISGINNNIANNAPILTYINNEAIFGNTLTLAPTALGSIKNLNISPNTILLSNEGGTLSTNDLATALGGIIDSDILYSAAGGNITLGNTIHPVTNLISNANTTFSIDGVIAPVAGGSGNFTFYGPTIINSTLVSSAGNQAYNNLLTLNTDSTISGNQINFNGIAGNHSLNLVGTSLSLNGPFSMQNLTVSGAGSDNSFALNSGNALAWNITGRNIGYISGMPGISGSFIFNNIQNLIGGNEPDNFIFGNNASITGLINGGSLATLNTLNYLAYTSPLRVVLRSGLYEGNTFARGSLITSFANINNLVTNGQNSNSLTLPNKHNSLVITQARDGYINDPLFFSGFDTFISTSGIDNVFFLVPANISFNTAVVNGVTMTFTNFGFNNNLPFFIDVSRIIQQPDVNGDQKPSSSDLAGTSYTLDENFADLLNQTAANFNSNTSLVKINPYCSG